MHYLSQPHIQEWLNEHTHSILGIDYSAAFHAYLEGLPWHTAGVRWGLLDHTTLPLDDEPNEQQLEWLLRTPVGSHEWIMISYTPDEESILCRPAEAFLDADLLYSHAPGPRYFCGADVREESLRITAQDFGEFDNSGFVIHLPAS